MKKVFLITLVFLFSLSISSVAHAEKRWHFNFGLIPAGMMISPDAEDFKARIGSAGGSTEESLEGNALYTPGAFIGLDFDTYRSGIGFDIFGNYVWSDAATGSVGGLNLSYIFPHNENGVFSARIKAGIIGGSLDWEGDHTTVEFDNATGWQSGLGFDIGKKVRFYAELLYRSLEFDVDREKSDTVNKSTLDLSGAVINLGIKFSF